MPVDTYHPQAAAALDVWARVRDCLAGERAVKSKGPAYLPKLTEQEQADYESYLDRALFFNATGRTAEAMTGLLFRKPPEQDLDASFDAFITDADMRGNPFVGYARKVAGEAASVGRGGTLIDWSEAESRPYAAFYMAEDVINWQEERRGGRVMLTRLVLRETIPTPKADDPFVCDAVIQYRELFMGESGVEVAIWKKGEDGKFAVAENPPMTRKQERLKEIPFVFHNADEPGPAVGRCPLSDLAAVNISHFRTSADLENGRHICGLPTPYAFGMSTNDDEGKPQKFYLGASAAWTSTNAQAKAGFIEFTGQGLGALEKAAEEKEKQMAALGARLIEPPKKDAEAYETVQLRATSEASTLARIGLLTTEGLVQILAWASWWMGTAATPKDAAEGIVFALNKDFVSAAITPEMLTAIVAARQANLISAETMFFNLQRGEFYPDGHTVEDEADMIETNPPMPAPLPINPNTNDPNTGEKRPNPDPPKQDPPPEN